ncbi:MAG: hypothetical protein EXR00_08920 [Alphaproteobacteria bacterium]|nr:hypothetical protein [Alphaproteobacteria bacterium]
MFRLRFLPLMFLPLAAGGCETLGLSDGPVMVVETISPCPSTAVLSDAVTVTKVKPGTPSGMAANPQNVVLTAEMSRAQLECDYDREANTLSVDISFAVRATRGAGAAGAAEPALDYFVAIVDIDNNVLVKKQFQSRPALGNRQTGVFQENVESFAIPLMEGKRPYDYEILTGFQLTPDELAYNRIPKPVPLRRP